MKILAIRAGNSTDPLRITVSFLVIPLARPDRESALFRLAGALPKVGAVGVGVTVAGATAYAFLTISGRVLGPKEFAPLASFWFLAFFLGGGLFLPIEQTLARTLADPQWNAAGFTRAVRRVGVGLAGAVALVIALASPALLGQLFDQQPLLVVALAFVVVGYYLEHYARGVAAGTERFGAYGRLLAVEGLARLVVLAALLFAGVRTAGGLATAAAVAVYIGVASAWTREPRATDQGGGSPRIVGAVLLLVVASMAAQLLANAAPLAAGVLAKPEDAALVGQFGSGVVISRIPLFLFQAVQAVLLPKLAASASGARWDRFRSGVTSLCLILAMGTAVLSLVMAVAGPQLLRIIFGPEFNLSGSHLALLTTASGVHVIGVSLWQGLVALEQNRAAAAGWVAGAIAFAAALAIPGGILTTVTRAFIVSEVVAVVLLGAALAVAVRHATRAAAPLAPMAGTEI